MGTTTFTGPIKAGDVLNTTGTTAGTVKNVGFVMMVQVVPITQAGTAAATATAIVIPAYSHIVQIQILATVAWSGAASTISLGTSATATELVSAGSVASIGINGLTPGTDATRTALWSNVGATDDIIYALSANTGAGVGDLVIRYIQAENA
tara:strand:+ start:1174 stop:1626 length:453 start_codon:yes stop_codon:yes gene_type:complete